MDDLDAVNTDDESKDNESKGNELRDLDAGDEFEETITMTDEQVRLKGATDKRAQIIKKGEQAQNINDSNQKSKLRNIQKELEIIYPTNYQYNNKRGSRNAICSVNLDDGNYLKKLFCCS